MIKIVNIKASIEESNEDIMNKAIKLIHAKNCKNVRIVKKAIDARNKSNIYYVCTVEAEVDNEDILIASAKRHQVVKTERYNYKFPEEKKLEYSPVIIGCGPAGLFAGLVLAQNGYAPIIIERGKAVNERIKDVERFRLTGELNPESNVQFGEGGAGTFSDGKLNTGIKDSRINKVFEEFVAHGAPEEILYLAKPHIGTDKLRNIVAEMRNDIISLGGSVQFETRLDDLIIEHGEIKGVRVKNCKGIENIETHHVLLAAGHSARDVFDMLEKHNVLMEPKPFSVGARIEHSQQMISKSQYGKFYRKLPPADYKLAVHLSNGRSAYTFCMCPGGEVIGGASEAGGVVTNGMSNFARNGKNANSALLVNVTPHDFHGILGGIEFQRKIEKKAFILGNESYKAPAQTVEDFLKGSPTSQCAEVIPTYKPGVVWGDISECLPKFVTESMRMAIVDMEKRLNGFASSGGVLTAPETRSSSPVRLVRNKENYMLSIRGLFSAGEGGGHAGGITSAAVDGIKAAEAIAKN